MYARPADVSECRLVGNAKAQASAFSERDQLHHAAREIFQQVEDKAEAQKLVDRIRCVGVPGQWSVGIYIHGEGVVNPIPYRTFKTYGEGFSQLLGWLRTRNFQLYDS